MNIHEGSHVLVNILTCAFSALRLSTPTLELCWEHEAHCPPHLSHTNKSVDSERHRFMQFTQEWCTPTYLYFTVLWCESKAHVLILTLYSPFFLAWAQWTYSSTVRIQLPEHGTNAGTLWSGTALCKGEWVRAVLLCIYTQPLCYK